MHLFISLFGDLGVLALALLITATPTVC